MDSLDPLRNILSSSIVGSGLQQVDTSCMSGWGFTAMFWYESNLTETYEQLLKLGYIYCVHFKVEDLNIIWVVFTFLFNN